MTTTNMAPAHVTFRTVTDLKRALRPGVTVRMIEHIYPELVGDRVVVKEQTQKFSTRLPVDHPRYAEVPNGSWMDYPKAAQFRANEDGSVTVLDETGALFVRFTVLAD